MRIFLCSLFFVDLAVGFVVPSNCGRETSLLLAKQQSNVLEEEAAPAGIVGSQFFGGSKEKEEYFSAEDEAKAGEKLKEKLEPGTYHRFFIQTKDKDDKSLTTSPSAAFETLLSAKVAASLQSQINAALYEGAPAPNTDYTYADATNWQTPLTKSKGGASSSTGIGTFTPLQELENSVPFYKQVDLAIVSGKQLTEDTVELQWELSVLWPTFWLPRVFLVGTSVCRLEGSTIVQQTDQLLENHNADVLSTIGSQIKPRFWDWYHIGMTPSAELMPHLFTQNPSLFGGADYQVYEIPSRLVTSPSILEVGDRNDRNAQTVPNHAFSCIIKTMGPKRQRMAATTPVEVKIIADAEGLMKLKWSIPLSVQFQSNLELPIAGGDPEMLSGSNPECNYEFHQRRRVATVPYGGNPQDKEITEIRKKLYEQVNKNGLKPKLDETGRPVFFFLQNTVKACYTEEGLGMCVYEWRPKLVKPNEVGIELELS